MAQQAPPSDNIFVADLPADMTQDGCMAVFSGYGTVTSCRVMPPNMPGKKSAALVRFSSVDEASWVVENLNGNLAEGLLEPIVVRFANAPGAKSQTSWGGGQGGDQTWGAGKGGNAWGASSNTSTQQGGAQDNVFIGSLPETFTMQDCQQVFQQYGTIAQCRVIQAKHPGGKASALIRFASPDEAAWVVENLNGNLPEGLESPIVAKFANAPGQQGDAQAGGQTWGSQGGKGGQQWTPTKAGNDSAPQQGGAQDNVFIGSLPETFSMQDCQQVFQQYGTISQCRVIPPKTPGGPASALIRFASPEEAAWVVENLNGNLAEGLEKPIVARFANNAGQAGGNQGPAWGGKNGNRSEPYSGGKGMKGGGKDDSFYSLYGAVKKAGLLGGGSVPNEQQIFVKNLPTDTTDLDLYKLFAPFGAIAASGAKAMTNPDGTCKGIGFVDYTDASCAQAAIAALHGFQLASGAALGVSTKVGGKAGGKGGGKGGF